ncbi:chitinase-3-like protein 2 isoform X1 [Eupeodes corollae]|uniref:chitinase-3-like protein 2 isoform X1 n=1 Tax=Eupeodes corollae TaxID=290404 RepID=UPI0024910C5B|nr:chitinase-3-like protein 2 isoform X1 [Eupeodes corollae]
MAEYQLFDETNGYRYSYCRLRLFVALYVLTTIAVFTYWNAFYTHPLVYPPNLSDVPEWWYKRAFYYANNIHETTNISHDFRIYQLNHFKNSSKNSLHYDVKEPPDYDETIYRVKEETPMKRLVCYYTVPTPLKQMDALRLSEVDGYLCTHINIGIADVQNNTITLTDDLRAALNESRSLRTKNPNIKILLWVGGADSNGFVDMVRNHANRKIFIQSLKKILSNHSLDGVDLDWEFPTAYNRERQHFSQLLREIRQEYIRERKNYLLTVAVAAAEGIALFAYDAREINLYADFANIMTYDYHFYARSTPFTGLNAPLFARYKEHSILGTLNINYSVNFWLKSGLDRQKLVVGLPTYGHSFTLVNPFNNGIESPASGIGGVGSMGFASFSEICWFRQNNIFLTTVFDEVTCSPYIYGGTEWISFEDEKSVACKTKYIAENDLGGAMIFSLNTDDYSGFCDPKSKSNNVERSTKEDYLKFPLVQTVKAILFDGK